MESRKLREMTVNHSSSVADEFSHTLKESEELVPMMASKCFQTFLFGGSPWAWFPIPGIVLGTAGSGAGKRGQVNSESSHLITELENCRYVGCPCPNSSLSCGCWRVPLPELAECICFATRASCPIHGHGLPPHCDLSSWLAACPFCF